MANEQDRYLADLKARVAASGVEGIGVIEGPSPVGAAGLDRGADAQVAAIKEQVKRSGVEGIGVIDLTERPKAVGTVVLRDGADPNENPHDTRCAKHLETGYSSVLERYHAGLPPDHVHVPT